MREERPQHLHLYLPRLPDLKLGPRTDSWIEEWLWMNCGLRLLEVKANGETERSLLESCSIHSDGASYRLQIRKGFTFADGSEITASHVVKSLMTIAADPQHPTQLQALLRATPERSFKLHTRYRFEILLREPVADLLERLALPESSLQVAGLPAGGNWTIEARDSDHLLLRRHPQRLQDGSIQEVRVETLAVLTDFAKAPAEAFAALFPGTLMKAPVSHALSETETNSLQPHFLLGLWLHQRHESRKVEALRQALQSYARQRSTWRKQRLSQIFPAHSFGYEMPPSEATSLEHQPRSWRLTFDPSLCAPAFVDDFAAFAQHHFQLQLSFHPLAATADATLFALPEYAAGAHLTSLQRALQLVAQLPTQVFDEHLRSLQRETRTPRRQALLRQLLQKLTVHPQFLPFLRTHLLSVSNRTLVSEIKPLGTLSLEAIGERLQRQRHEELRTATVSALGSAVQMLAHDIKRPFGMLESLMKLMTATDDPQRLRTLAQQHLPEVRRVAHTVQEMISDILEMGSEQELLTEPVSPLAALEESLRLLPPSHKEITLNCRWEHRLLLEADKYKLSRIFSNIITNAIQAMPHRAQLSISSREGQDGTRSWIEITLHNSGSFIPADRLPRIFEAFFTAGKEQGTGLGLAIVKKFVLAHEGHIRCESDRERGTFFYLTLPCSYKEELYDQTLNARINAMWQQLMPAAAAAVTRAASREGLRLLMIDDDPLDIDCVQHLVAAASLGSLVATSSAEAGLAAAAATAFDLILLDYQLGKINGLDLIQPLQKLQAGARIVLHSHLATAELQRASLQAGAMAFAPKPLSPALAHALTGIASAGPLLILVEDDPIFTEIWQQSAGAALKAYPHPEALLQAVQLDAALLSRCLCLITDGRFDGSSIDGPRLLETLSAEWPALPVALCSHLTEKNAGWPRIVKEPEAIAAFVAGILNR